MNTALSVLIAVLAVISFHVVFSLQGADNYQLKLRIDALERRITTLCADGCISIESDDKGGY